MLDRQLLLSHASCMATLFDVQRAACLHLRWVAQLQPLLCAVAIYVPRKRELLPASVCAWYKQLVLL